MDAYKSKLNLLETEVAIKYIKDTFEKELAKKLSLVRVSAPLFVIPSTGLNDNLNGVEEPISFIVKGINEKIEIVHSLAKWKRQALVKYNLEAHRGIYTDMNAIRKDELLDNIHSLYVDQWDYEIIINPEERNLRFLFKTVRKIYSVMNSVENKINKRYPCFAKKLPKSITFISTTKAEKLFPNLSRKQREHELSKKYGAIFLYKIGWPLKDKLPHDGRAPDYDDWNLNGDIIVYNSLLDIPFEISSMGIRVDSISIRKQISHRHQEHLFDTTFVKDVIDNKLPLTLGGGIGQSRLCMFYLEKAHIGEVQCSIWSEEEKEKAEKQNIKLL